MISILVTIQEQSKRPVQITLVAGKTTLSPKREAAVGRIVLALLRSLLDKTARETNARIREYV